MHYTSGFISATCSNTEVFHLYRHLKEIFFTGESSLFREYSLPDQHGSVFNIWNLKKDLDGRKHWSQVGLITPSGLALEPIMGLNGNTLTPLLHPRRPILRVPVVLSSSLVEAKDPALAENRRTCVGRALPCRARNSTQQGEGLLCCFGASIDFLKFLQRDLGFDTEIYLTPDGQYGKLDPSKGKWTGIVNEIVSGKADLAIDLSVSMQRSKFIDMLYPNVPTALNILVKTENSHGKQGTSISLLELRCAIQVFIMIVNVTLSRHILYHHQVIDKV